MRLLIVHSTLNSFQTILYINIYLNVSDAYATNLSGPVSMHVLNLA